MTRRHFFKLTAGCAVLAGATAAGARLFLRQPAFGALPEETPALLNSPHYGNSIFHNTLPTPILSDGSSFAWALIRSLFTRRNRPFPPVPVPSVHAGSATLETACDKLVWLGHSSFLVQLSGARVLIDPVFSPFAAPLSFSTRAFPGTTPYTVADLPRIDALLISHDHWDHLDYPTIMALRHTIGHVVCPLGAGAHFRRWGFAENAIHELDWGDSMLIGSMLRVQLTEARHYAGRGLTRDKALWGGFMLQAGGKKLFYSGDSGYGPHFAALGRAFGGVDAALLDCGQYDPRWRYIHMTPEEAVRAAEDLGARALLPAHVGKFALSRHAWDEPFQRIVTACRGKAFQLLTPRIGEPVELATPLPVMPFWWETLSDRSKA